MNWIYIRSLVISFLKGEAVKLALKKLLGSALLGGFKVWVIKFIVTELFEEFAEPLIKYAFRNTEYQFNRVKGKMIVKKLIKAKEAGNEEAYDDMLSKL